MINRETIVVISIVFFLKNNLITKQNMFKMTFFIFIPITFLISFILVYTDPKFGRLPKGERLERIKNSPNYKNGRFENLNYTPQLTSEKSRFMTMYDFLFRKEENIRPTTPIPFIKSDLKQISQELNYIVWFGHSSYLLQINGKRILVDPVFYDASPVSFFNKPFEGTDYYTADMIPGIDYLIITHDHWDHLDYKTVTKLRDRIDKVICPLGVGEHFEKWKFNQNAIIETDWYDSIDFGNDFKIHCLPARHFSGRGLKSNKSLWASFMIESDSKTIFLSGDGDRKSVV